MKGVSISDDDLCAGCRRLDYCPGEISFCSAQVTGGWPCMWDADGYSASCEEFATHGMAQ